MSASAPVAPAVAAAAAPAIDGQVPDAEPSGAGAIGAPGTAAAEAASAPSGSGAVGSSSSAAAGGAGSGNQSGRSGGATSGASPPGVTGDQYKSNSLYVGDLNETVNENTLYTHFNAVASVGSVHVCRNINTRRSLGYAYVNFHSVEDSEKAMEELNYSAIQGRPCRIMWSNRNPGLRKSNRGNIFIKNLDPSIDNKALHDTMAQFGEILSCKIALYPSGKSKGYGFVHYATDEAADKAIAMLNGMNIQGKEVYVTRFKKSQNTRYGGEWTNLYVRNIPPSWNEAKLHEVFSGFGEVNSTKLNKPSNGGKLAYGFVDMGTHESAVAAVDALHQHYIVAEGDEAEALQNPTVAASKKKQAQAKAAAKLKERVLAASGGENKSEVDGGDQADGKNAAAAESAGETAAEGDATATAASAVAPGEGTGGEAAESEEGAATEDNKKDTKKASEKGGEGEEPTFETAKIFLYVQRAQRREVREKERRDREEQRRRDRALKFQGMNIYIKNLADSVTDEVLRRAFNDFGTITSAKVMFSKEGTSRGFGFVCYSSQDEANKAIAEMQGKTLDGKQIAVSIAQPKKVRGDFMQRRHGSDGGYNNGGGRYNNNNRYNNHHNSHHHNGRGGGAGGRNGARGRNNGHGGNRRGSGQNGMYSPNMYYPQGAMMYPAMMNSVMMGGRGGQMMRGIPIMPASGYQNMPQNMQGMPSMQGMPNMQMQGSPQNMQQGMSPQQQHMYAQQYAAQQQAQYQYAQQHAAQQYAAQQHMQMQRAQQMQQQQQQQPSQGQQQGVSGDKTISAGSNVASAGQQGNKSGGRSGGAKGGRKGRNAIGNLSGMSAIQQKNFLGEQLYPLIRGKLSPQHSTYAGKVTGMLLEGYGTSELLNLIEDSSALSRRIGEAVKVLEAAQ